MTEEEFKLLTTDTDEFMRQSGYLSTNETARAWNVSGPRVRQLVQNGVINDVCVGNKRYIKVSDYPIKHGRWRKD